MTSDDALQLLGHLCATSLGGALRELGAEVEVGAPVLVQPGFSPVGSVPAPGVAVAVELDGGLAGVSTLLLADAAARLLAPEEEPAPAAARAGAHVAAAVAATAGGVLGADVPVGTPTVSSFAGEGDAPDPAGGSAHAVVVPFAVGGEAGRLVLAVQNAFLVRATPGLAELEHESETAGARADRVAGDALREVAVRVWAELGRAQLPLAQAVALPGGAVVQLDRGADDPIELFVNGRLFAHGRLAVVDGEWAIEIEELVTGDRGEATPLVPQPAPAAVDNA